MKKLLIFTIVSLLAFTPALADNYRIGTEFKKKSGTIGNGIGRAPINLSIEVSFDDTTGVLTVQAPEDMEGCVYVYNINGGLEASSDHLNATLTLPPSGMHIVSLQGDSWIGEGRFIF